MFCSAGRRAELIKNFKNELKEKMDIIVVDNSNTAPALYMVENRYVVPKIHDENYIPLILELCKKENVKAITTLIDPEISVLSRNIDKFSEVGIMVLGSPYEVAEICFDKYKTYEFLKMNGFKCVETYDSLSKFKLAYELRQIEFPVFIKPRSGSGSVGIKKINTMENLQNHLDGNEDFIIQEFMDGTEYDADVYVDMISGELVSAFTKKKISTRIGGADKTVSYKDKKLFNLIELFVKELGLRGPADIDFFEKNGEYYISEVNPRFGGSYLHAHTCGVNFLELISNNINGVENEYRVGDFEENLVMMMYDSIVIKKVDDLV